LAKKLAKNTSIFFKKNSGELCFASQSDLIINIRVFGLFGLFWTFLDFFGLFWDAFIAQT
jgi:hypothetical protein